MTKKKRIISIVLAVALIISATTTLFIATANAKEASISITVDKTALSAGESATVSVKVTTNFPVATMSIPVFYDKTLVSVSDATATLTDYTFSNAITEESSVDSDKIYANTDISSSKFGFVLVSYIGGAKENVPATTDAVVLTFKITAKADVSGDAVLKCVSGSVKTESNIEGMLYFGSTTTDTTIDSIPENVEKVDVSSASAVVKIGDVANTIAIKDGANVEAYIDTVNNCGVTGIIYGIDTLGNISDDGALADNLTTAYGDEYLAITEADGGETTGTIIEVLDEDGNAVETYVFVYFGDIDMDGMITSTDGFFTEYYEGNGEGIEELYQFIAGDIDGDGMITSTDGFYMEYFEGNGEGIPTQQEIAELVSANSYEM